MLDATARGAIEGIVLRYGLFYGPETPSTVAMIAMVRSGVCRSSAATRAAAVDPRRRCRERDRRALDVGAAGGSYDIVDDRAVSMTEFVEAIADTRGRRRPFGVPAVAAAACRSVHGAHDLDSDAALERQGAGGAGLARRRIRRCATVCAQMFRQAA